MKLDDLFRASVRHHPDHLAVDDGTHAWTYAELDRVTAALRLRLAQAGVGTGDRVAMLAEKSGPVLAAFQAALQLGAAYVPLDPASPDARITAILDDCAPAVIVTDRTGPVPASTARPAVVRLADAVADAADVVSDVMADPTGHDTGDADGGGGDALAYILYTSGSTGTPKGVCISHRNALAFVEWAVEACGITTHDRLSNHAPLTFDLSVLDVYAAFACAASVHLVPRGLSYSPAELAQFLVRQQITVWYSVPSALVIMADLGGLHRLDLTALRAVLFAGEPYPVQHLRRLREQLPDTLMMNLYGPTETNVCTAYTVAGTIPPDQDRPVPIGSAASGDEVWAQRPDGSRAGVGETGQLMVSGPTVMLGYWGREPQASVYATGDNVCVLPDGVFDYLGRLDQMVKVRGHRIELGDIETALAAHPDVSRATVVAVGSGLATRLVAFVLLQPGGQLALMPAKAWLADRLPPYMSIDDLRPVPALPRTANGKVDRSRLRETVTAS